MLNNNNAQGGYVLLTTVVILGAVGLTIAVALLLGGTGQVKTSLSRQQSSTALSYAESCVEDGLLQIRNNTLYTGNKSISFFDGYCSYVVSNTGGTSRQLLSTGSVGQAIKKVKVVVSSVSPQVTISSWQQVGDF